MQQGAAPMNKQIQDSACLWQDWTCGRSPKMASEAAGVWLHHVTPFSDINNSGAGKTVLKRAKEHLPHGGPLVCLVHCFRFVDASSSLVSSDKSAWFVPNQPHMTGHSCNNRSMSRHL